MKINNFIVYWRKSIKRFYIWLLSMVGVVVIFGVFVWRSVYGADLLAGPTDLELLQLPNYCTPRVKENDKLAWNKGLARFGETWNHLHHYCYALTFLNRYYASKDQGYRRHILTQVVDNINYVIDRAPKNDPFLPQLYTDRGATRILQGNGLLGLGDLQKAIEINPEHSMAYRNLVSYHVNGKRDKEAMEWVVKGLKHVPGDKVLKKRYVELGGVLPYPVVETSKKPSNEKEESPVLNGKSIEVNKKREVINEDRGGVPMISVPHGAGENKANPYCRFCPE